MSGPKGGEESLLGNQRGEVIAGATLRTDAWWIEQLLVVLVLGGFGVYATWAALVNAHYYAAPYLSPFYSPCLAANCQHVTLPLIGSWWNLSPAFLILWVPGGFRATCYYYRKAYYRSFFADPLACAVGEARKGYRGETAFPFILQNLHRYFLYAALIILIFLWWDVFRAFTFGGHFGLGLGSLAILTSTATLTLYTFSCHSLRHIVGGSLDCFSCAVAGGPRRRTWALVSVLNEHHMGWAWGSLFAVCFADLYVRLCSMGIWRDFRLF